jgi:hypothetical protein
VTTDGAGNWVAVWRSNDSLGGAIGTDSDILVARSTDNGMTWTAPAPLNTNAATDSGNDWEPQVTTDGAGNWVAVWWSDDSQGDTIDIDPDILVARSTDNGMTWTAAAPLNTNAATDSGGDFFPHVATDGAGNWVVVWWSNDSLGGAIGTDTDILVARSTTSVAPTPTPEPGGQLQGDVDCNDLVNTVDALIVLLEEAGLPHGAECLEIAGDVNCDGATDGIGPLGILRYVDALPPLPASEDCPPVGAPL